MLKIIPKTTKRGKTAFIAMKLILGFSIAQAQGTSSPTTESYEFKTQWVKEFKLTVEDAALLYPFFAQRPQLLQSIKSKYKGSNKEEYSYLSLDSVRIETMVDLGMYIRQFVGMYQNNYLRLESQLKINPELRKFLVEWDDKQLKQAVQNGKGKLEN